LLNFLCCLGSCSAVGIQAANLAYNIPGYKEQLQIEAEERKTCVINKDCSAYYYDKESGAWLTHRYSTEELEDQKTAKEDNDQCLKAKKCIAYKITPFPETLVHKYNEEELKTLEKNRLYKLEMDRIADENDRMFHRGKYGQ
jgi:hypothetical protein